MSNNGESYLLSINYMGQDVQVMTEDFDTANLLLNDQHAAFEFLNRLDPDKYPIPGGSRDTQVPLFNFNVPQQDLGESRTSSVQNGKENVENEEIWCKKKPTEKDLMATELFLSLRDQYKDKFNDTKTTKTSIWKIIAKKLMEENYNLGKDPVEKCRQKWANLQKKYLEHMKHLKTTGVERIETPPFFDILHGILGSKDKTNPRMLIDSEDIISESTSEATEVPSMPKTALAEVQAKADNRQDKINEIKKRFSSTIVPKTATAKICQIIKEESEKDRKQDKEQFKKLEEILVTQNDQRREFLDILKKIAPVEAPSKEPPRKKRRPNCEDSDSHSD
ncbi:unnamed protein product [Ceutorhynchus assimilis]|uniref:Myb/SANT-like DNA-binding domain-containing protein n=1 Tax=Ceutorhynchus assimilis TaxID=467358 RepID=A0A9N9MFD2_9CUCU|nr:unnamed protein product [Ceutorhynchus assimilis]